MTDRWIEMEQGGFVYILSSRTGVLYIGVTNDLERRLSEHKQGIIEGFTKRYHAHKLLYYEPYDDITNAIAREKQLKGWRREKKAALIERENPGYEDISLDWYETASPTALGDVG